MSDAKNALVTLAGVYKIPSPPPQGGGKEIKDPRGEEGEGKGKEKEKGEGKEKSKGKGEGYLQKKGNSGKGGKVWRGKRGT